MTKLEELKVARDDALAAYDAAYAACDDAWDAWDAADAAYCAGLKKTQEDKAND